MAILWASFTPAKSFQRRPEPTALRHSPNLFRQDQMNASTGVTTLCNRFAKLRSSLCVKGTVGLASESGICNHAEIGHQTGLHLILRSPSSLSIQIAKTGCRATDPPLSSACRLATARMRAPATRHDALNLPFLARFHWHATCNWTPAGIERHATDVSNRR